MLQLPVGKASVLSAGPQNCHFISVLVFFFPSYTQTVTVLSSEEYF